MRSRVVTGFAAIAAAACTTLAPVPGTVVVGRGDPAVDVEAVQRAVDQGGRVLLKGTFDFGPAGSVRITRDVEVLGEADAAGRPRTLIRGGQAALRSLPPDAPAAGPKIAIRGIHFDGATWMAVHIAHASDTTVSGNVFTHLRPIAFPGGALSQGKPYNMQQALVIGGLAVTPAQPLAYRTHGVTGPLAVTGNDFDLETEAVKSTVGMAIWVVRTTGIRGELAGNTVRNASRNAIEAIDNFRSADGNGQLAILGNEVVTPTEGTLIPTPRTPNGIVVGYFLEPKVALDESRAIAMSVAGNTVRLRGKSAPAVGISVMMNKAQVSANRLVLDAPGAIGIAVTGSFNRIADNRFEGSGWAGIHLAPLPPMTPSQNELAGNDFTAVRTSTAHVSFAKGANANRVVGSTGSVQDQGEGNVTQGLSPVAQAR